MRSPSDSMAWKDIASPLTQPVLPHGARPQVDSRISSAKERLVQLNVALEGANLGFWDWNRKSNLLAVNEQWAKMLGLTVRDIRHADDFYERLHPDDKSHVEKELSRYSQGRTRLYRAKLRLRHKDGHYVPIEAVGAFQLNLVVDDISINRMILRNDLESRGIEVQEADNGQAVLTLFADPAFQTDVVLMDIQMPVMDGITATRKLREDFNVEVPILGITADATQDTKRDGLDAGMNEVLFKPIDVESLVNKMVTQSSSSTH